MSIDIIGLNIDEKARSYAKIYASLIQDEFQRKRANAAIIALFAYIGLLKKAPDINIQNAMTLYKNPSLCEQFEIADFYANNYHIDVRVTTEDDIAIVPKSHYDNDIVPDFYVVVKMDTSLKKADFVGIIDTARTQPEPFDYHYYKFEADAFISNEEFINRIENAKILKFDIKEHEEFQDNYLGFIDNEISTIRKINILKHLFKCPDCRTEFCCFTGFEMVNCNASTCPEILDDKTLDIVGAQGADNEKYKGKEETIYIGTDDVKQQESAPAKEPKEQNFNASSMMSEDEYLNDETQMDFVPYEDAAAKEAENKDNEQELTLIKDENSSDGGDILDELFSSDEEEKSEIEEIKGHELFEDVPEGLTLKPDDMQIIDDGEADVDTDDMSIIEKDFSDGLTDTNGLEVRTEPKEGENVQKVIIDYDEYGEPIYSYITNADGTGPASEIQNIDDSELIEDIDDDFTKGFEQTEPATNGEFIKHKDDIDEPNELDIDLDDLIETSSEEETTTAEEVETSQEDSVIEVEMLEDVEETQETQTVEDTTVEEVVEVEKTEEIQEVQEEDNLDSILDEVFVPIKDPNMNYDFVDEVKPEEQPKKQEEQKEASQEKEKEEETASDEPIEEESKNDTADEISDKNEDTQETTTQDNEPQENTEAEENSEDEFDILDQMFVDGALEREAREQQAVSYNILGTPVDSHIPSPEADKPDTCEVEEKEEAAEEEKETTETLEEVNDIEELKEEPEHIDEAAETEELQAELVSEEIEPLEETEVIDNTEETEEAIMLTEEVEESPVQEDTDATKEEAAQKSDIDVLYEEEPETTVLEDEAETITESYEQADNETISEEIQKDEETEISEIEDTTEEIEEEQEYNNEEADYKEIKEEEPSDIKEDDALLSALPTSEEKLPMFDGYIESELSKSNDDTEEEEYDEEDDEEYDDEEYDNDDDEEGDDEMENENKSASKIVLIIVTIVALLALLGGGAFLFLKNNKNDNQQAIQNEIPQPEVVDEQSDMFDIPIDDNNYAIPFGEDNSEMEAQMASEGIKKINLGNNEDIQIGSDISNTTQDVDTLPLPAQKKQGQVEMNTPVKTLTESDLTQNTSHGDFNKAITNALSNGDNLITLRAVNWFCASELISDKAFRNYMQNLDNTLKQNLKNNIMKVTAIPPKNEVEVKFAIDNERNLRKVLITKSSDLEEVDKIVLQSINETFEGEKSPILTDSPQKSDMYYFKVVIKL